jgi:branched-chain amino acid transport system ATP-binding protein
MLTVENIRAGYGKFSVLDNVSISAREGRFLGVLGRNGVGKTTLLKTIAGPVKVNAGAISFRGASIERCTTPEIVERGIALVLDRKGIFRSLSVRENLALAEDFGRRRAKRPWTTERVLTTFPRLGERLHAPGGGLSGGEQQMLAIGRALLTQPSLLLLDEPTEGLAPKIVEELVEMLRRLRSSGLTAIVVDQRLETVFDTCDEIVVMSRGTIAASGVTEDIRSDEALLEQHLGV